MGSGADVPGRVLGGFEVGVTQGARSIRGNTSGVGMLGVPWVRWRCRRMRLKHGLGQADGYASRVAFATAPIRADDGTIRQSSDHEAIVDRVGTLSRRRQRGSMYPGDHAITRAEHQR
jgi:hypothetical protein